MYPTRVKKHNHTKQLKIGNIYRCLVDKDYVCKGHRGIKFAIYTQTNKLIMVDGKYVKFTGLDFQTTINFESNKI